MNSQEQQQELYRQELQGALPAAPTSTGGGTPMVAGEAGNWLTRLFDGEGRLHHDIMVKIDHVTREAASAEIAIGQISNVLLASVLETEAGYESTLQAYRGSVLAMAVAPTIIQLARAIHLQGATTIQQHAVQAICRQLGRR